MRPVLSALAALVLAAPAAAQQERATFAVLPFRNEQSFGLDAGTYQGLELAIPQLLAAEIGRSPGGRLADRAGTAQAVGARTPATRLDAAAAQRIGGVVGARFVVTGNFVDAFGKMRINARVVDVSTGQFVASATNDDPALHDRAKLHAAIQQVARRLLEGLKLPPPAGGTALPTEAILAFGQGLAAEERGDKAEAATRFRAALEQASGFAEADEALQRVR